MDLMRVALDAACMPATLSSLSSSQQEDDNIVDHQVAQLELPQDIEVAVAPPKALTSMCFLLCI